MPQVVCRYAVQARREREPDRWADLAQGSNPEGLACMMAGFLETGEVIEARLWDREENIVVQG